MAMLKPKNILVPVDFSQQSERALHEAVDLARQSNAQVFVLHVISGTVVQCMDDYCLANDLVKQISASSKAQSTDDYAVTETMVKQIDAMVEKKSREMMTALIDKIPGARTVKVIPEIKKGTPYQVILEEEKKKSIDMIIIPPHGKAGFKDFFLGSTVDKVVNNGGCTVVVVK